ncbi:MAG: glycosyltransferase family 2 protein [Gemmatimonadaceae bacterium]
MKQSSHSCARQSKFTRINWLGVNSAANVRQVSHLERDADRVIAVVLNWNGPDLTVRCVDHLRAQRFPLSIVIIDNGSSDDSAQRLAHLVDARCELIVLPENLGYSGGCNVGIRIAVDRKATYVWIINNDAFAETNCLSLLVDHLDAYANVALVTPKLLNEDGSEQHAGGFVDFQSGDTNQVLSAELTQFSPDNRWLTGTAILIRVAALQGNAAFDDAFFAYWEDVDLSLRLTQAGYELRAVPDAIAMHLTSASTGGMHSPIFLYLNCRNQWILQRKYLSQRAVPGCLLRYSARYLEMYAAYSDAGDVAPRNAVWRAISDAWRGTTGAPPPCTNDPHGIISRHPWGTARVLRRLARYVDALLRSPARKS